MKKIMIIGGNGQLGTDLMLACEQAHRPAVGLTHGDIDICDVGSIDAALSGADVDMVINTAAFQGARAYTATDQSVFFSVNAIGVWNLARWCQRHDRLLVHYSTDYVFGGDRTRRTPYTEEDSPRPVNAYGNSKLAGEYFVRAFCRKHYVIRVASMYGSAGCRAKDNSNFVKMVVAKAARGEPLEIVNDQFMSPTWTAVAAAKTLELVDLGAEFGVYHMAGSGSCTWYEFAVEIVRLIGAGGHVIPTVTLEEDAEAVFLRPRYTALDNARLRQAGLGDMVNWREALGRFVRKECVK